jgi:endonuclease/exonuclease/phosphatase family metal-dependent hydrolase
VALWRGLGERGRGILSTLKALRPDIAGLQEVWATMETTPSYQLAEQLGMHAAFAAPSLPPPSSPSERPDQAGVEVGVAVLSRCPIQHVQQHRLPSQHRPEIVTLAAALDHPRARLHLVVSASTGSPSPPPSPLSRRERWPRC